MSQRHDLNRWSDSESAVQGMAPAPIPVHTTFRHMPPSPAVAARVNAEAQKLGRYYDRIHSCHVVVVAPHRHHRHGRQFSVQIELVVPRTRLLVNHTPASPARLAESPRVGKRDEIDAPHKDVYVVIRETFDAMRRRLEDYVRTQRGDVKRHAGETLKENAHPE